MNRDVKIEIIGSHGKGADRDIVKSYVEGMYFERDGKVFLKYAEEDQDTGAKRNALIKVEDKTVTVEYRGITDTVMIYDVGKTTKSMYITPLGSMPIEITTKSMTVHFTENTLDISIDYLMSLSGGSAETSSISIRAKS